MADTMPLVYSKHNIVGKIKDSIDYFLINILAGSADILDEETAIQLKNGLYPQKDDLEKKGYLINQEDEKILFINSYCEFSDREDKNTILIHFIPWFSCNLSCGFCPYKDMENKDQVISDIIIRDFFSYLDTYLADRPKIIVLSGGEPLLPGDKYRNVITRIFRETESRNIPVRVKTNGYFLYSYLPFLQNKKIESIRVSLDLNQTHVLKDNKKLEAGINGSLENGFKTHINMLINVQDMDKIHLLAAFAGQSGWIYNPLFSAGIISKDNILSCNSLHSLFPFPPDIIEKIYYHILKYPEILELFCPPFSITRYLHEKKHLPSPLFKTCPGGRSELVCTNTGKIYPCKAAIMKTDECFGTFYPEVTMQTNTLSAWDERDITTIKKCQNCSVQLGCGGGCTIKARDKTGNYLSPNCIPIKQLIETGLSLYFDKKLISE